MFHMVPTWISHMMKQKAKWISRMWSSMGNVSVSGVWAWYHHLLQLLLAVCQRSVLEMLHRILHINSLLDCCHPSSHPYIILTFTSMHLWEEARVHVENMQTLHRRVSASQPHVHLRFHHAYQHVNGNYLEFGNYLDWLNCHIQLGMNIWV